MRFLREAKLFISNGKECSQGDLKKKSAGYSEKKGDYVKGHRGKKKWRGINTPLGSKN